MERVHTVWEYYDGPRTGIADYLGQPHYFSCQWDNATDCYGDSYALSPIDSETFGLALEQWALWRKWEIAFHSGQVSGESHPGHGGQNARYDELQELIQARLDALPASGIYAFASFQPDLSGEDLPTGVMRPLLVEWSGAA